MAAAARLLLQRRLVSVLGLNQTRFALPVLDSGSIRHTSTKPSSLTPPTNTQDDPKPSKPNEQQSVSYNTFSNLKISPRHDMAMVFTCGVCETRAMKTASRDAYENGVVVARCPGCNNLHLIADRLGWFGRPGSVEEFLASKGEEVKRGSVDSLNFTLEDITGSTGKSS